MAKDNYNMKRIKYLAVGAALLALFYFALGAGAASTVDVTFWRQMHPQPQSPYLAVTLLCDGVNEGSRIVPAAPSLAPVTHAYQWTAGDCEDYTLIFTGAVYSGLGQKIDDVTLTVDGGADLIVNGGFDAGLDSWENPDTGTDGTNGGWTWAKARKQQAKLDGSGAGSNAQWGVEYRLRQTVSP